MKSNQNAVLTVNGGSSSIKFALYGSDEPLQQLLVGEIECIGSKNAKLSFANKVTDQSGETQLNTTGYDETIDFLINWLGRQQEIFSIKAIGHRIVFGMKHTHAELITTALVNELKQVGMYAPEHLPLEIKLIEMFAKSYAEIPQIACFDTAFHSHMPPVAQWVPIPRRYKAKGIQRYGFHGLSYAYLMEQLKAVAGKETTRGKIILAHLGNGASVAAIKEGTSIDTSMGFSPGSGIVMGTRTGDLDPGVALHLLQVEKLGPDQINHLINHESGLLGISETSGDMRDLLITEATDIRAREAVELFCYEIKKQIGAYIAVLGGLDTLVFTGGIGANAPEVRRRICVGLQFLGIELDEEKNKNNDAIISVSTGKVCVRVMQTNEEQMIAKLVCDIINKDIKN